MRRKESYSYKKEAYYFTVKSSPNNITMHRETKEAAKMAFYQYVNIGKQVDWLGKWNGKKFEDNSIDK